MLKTVQGKLVSIAEYVQAQRSMTSTIAVTVHHKRRLYSVAIDHEHIGAMDRKGQIKIIIASNESTIGCTG